MATDRSSHAISRRTYLKFGLGAMAGACLTGIVLVPLAGFSGAALLVALLKASSLAALGRDGGA